MVYTVNLSKDTVLHIEDILYDLHGNRFAVKNMERFGRDQAEEWHVGIMLEPLSGDATNFEGSIAKGGWELYGTSG